jgi:hypothetical protein
MPLQRQNGSTLTLTSASELTVVMGRSRDWDELQHSWIEWRRLTGQKMRDIFEQVVELSNQAARLNRKSSFLSVSAAANRRRDGRLSFLAFAELQNLNE